MTKEEHIKYWRESALRDLDSAKAILISGRYDWCLFVGHLVLEKILKALFVERNDNKIPPKMHNLIRLAELSGIELNDDQKFFLDKVNDYNISTRYPDYHFDFFKICNISYAKENLSKIEEFYKWLNSLLK